MQVKHAREVPQNEVTMEGAAGCKVRQLVGEADQAPNFAMRQFEIEPGGYTPRHFHPYEHEVFVLEGEGIVVDGNQPRQLRAGDVVYVAPDDVHQFRNTGEAPMKFLSLIPNSAAGKQVTVAAECSVGVTPPK
jgi:quercetin dioxygenase-like cupin family protein